MRIRIKSRQHLHVWRDRFVWFPRVVRDSDTGRRWFVWLETVRCKRQYGNGYVYWQYKLKDKV
jgi:hypothetical protein